MDGSRSLVAAARTASGLVSARKFDLAQRDRAIHFKLALRPEECAAVMLWPLR